MQPIISLHQPLALLGGLTPTQFMRRHWQKKPLLIRQAIPGVTSPISRAALFKLVQQQAVESRLILREDAPTASGVLDSVWAVRQGPIKRSSRPPVSQPGWTVLVQGLEQHCQAARDLLTSFRFMPQARLDDLMISWASPGGGVGPHLDSYDVFLLQVQGCRRWEIARASKPELLPEAPLKILTNFVAESAWDLEPGDMLYLPPKWAHHGIAKTEGMTCSIGFRAPERDEIVAEVLTRIADWQDDGEHRYSDKGQEPTLQPGRIPGALGEWAQHAVHRALTSDHAVAVALGEFLSTPKPRTVFSAPADGQAHWTRACRIELSPSSRMLYDDQHVYLNGLSWRMGGADAHWLRLLANQQYLTPAQLAKVPQAVVAWLQDMLAQGWLHMHPMDQAG